MKSMGLLTGRVTICAIVAGSCAFSQTDILMPPYLQAVTTTGIDVLVESKTTDPLTVSYGTTTHYTNSASTSAIASTDASTYVHDVKLTGLLPNTRYHYRARQGTSVSADATFMTAPEPGTPFRFAWQADFRTGTEVHDSVDVHIASFQPTLLLIGGDIATNSGYDAFKADFFRPLQFSLISNIPFFNSTGNHEGWTTNTRAFTRSSSLDPGSDGYYSFDYGDMHVLVLNTQFPCGIGSPQYAFAEKDLTATHRAWKVVMAHKPAYCGGGHGEDEEMKELTTGVLERTNVDLVLGGHSHFYQHNVVNKIHHMVIGTSGAPLYTPEPQWYTVAYAHEYNFAIGDVSPATFRLVVYNERGAVLDSLVLEKPLLPPSGDK